MISIRHEGSGPYVDRTVIEWNGMRTHGDVPDEETLEGLLGAASEGEDIESLKGALEEAQNETESALKEARDAEDKIDELENLLDEADPKGAIRSRLDEYRKQALRLGRRVKELEAENLKLRTEAKQGRARTCVICSKWSKHDDRGFCVHGKPIKGFAKRAKASAA